MSPAPDVQTRLLLLRHGEVTWDRTVDGEPSLSDAGLATVEATAATLPRFDHIAASPSRPARETAETIALVRGVTAWWHDDLDEIRTAAPPGDAQAYVAWLDRLFEALDSPGDAESVSDGGTRLAATLRRIGDRFHGRTVLVVSHPVILLAFRTREVHAPLARGHVDTMPDLAMATVDYLDGQFYIVRDFPVRWTAPQWSR
jgi:broad specificity phosphatase PhoE